MKNETLEYFKFMAMLGDKNAANEVKLAMSKKCKWKQYIMIRNWG